MRGCAARCSRARSRSSARSGIPKQPVPPTTSRGRHSLPRAPPSWSSHPPPTCRRDIAVARERLDAMPRRVDATRERARRARSGSTAYLRSPPTRRAFAESAGELAAALSGFLAVHRQRARARSRNAHSGPAPRCARELALQRETLVSRAGSLARAREQLTRIAAHVHELGGRVRRGTRRQYLPGTLATTAGPEPAAAGGARRPRAPRRPRR